MSRITPIQGLLANLRGEIKPGSRAYLPPAEAHRLLCELSGQDFGMDADRWKAWFHSRDQ